MRNYLSAAKMLDDLVLVLISEGMDIPAHVVEDMKSARSLASIVARDPKDESIAVRAEAVLESVEMNLLALTEICLGSGVAESWQERVAVAYKDDTPVTAPAPGFAAGVPKGDHWVRVQSSYMDTVDGATGLLEASGLTYTEQVDGYILIHGRKEDISALMSEIRQLVRDEGSENN